MFPRNLTFATVPLLLAGRGVGADMAKDRAPAVDLADIRRDIPFIASRNGQRVNWRWYEEGYDREPTDPAGEVTHAGYVSHHNGAQYFGYIANNPALTPNLRGLGDAFADLAGNKLPKQGGVFYIRGGFVNVAGQTPPIQNASFPGRASPTTTVQPSPRRSRATMTTRLTAIGRSARLHGGAGVINAVAGNAELRGSESLIIVTYDQTDGFFDHVRPDILSYGPDKLPLARGIRIPMILISPYARAHVVSHAEGDRQRGDRNDRGAVRSAGPGQPAGREAKALLSGADPQFNGPDGFVQHHLGPRDINTPATTTICFRASSRAGSPENCRDAAGQLRNDPGDSGEHVAALRRQGLFRHWHGAGGPAPAHRDHGPGRIQYAAGYAAAIQHGAVLRSPGGVGVRGVAAALAGVLLGLACRVPGAGWWCD